MSTTATYSVQGMTCGGCAKRVRTAIEADVPGLSDIQIDPKAGRVQVTADEPFSDEMIQAAVGKTSYTYAGPLA